MTHLHLGSAIRAGLVGTLAMTLLMYAAPLMGLPPMDLLAALGGLVPLGISPYLVGGLIHLGIGISLALLYAIVFDRLLPGAPWARGLQFSLLPWLFAITLMGPAMAWIQGVLSLPAKASALAAPTNPCATSRPANPCAAAPGPKAGNPCGIQPKVANPCAPAAPKPGNPCGAVAASTAAPSSWLVRMMSLMAHLVYGGAVGAVYRRRG